MSQIRQMIVDRQKKLEDSLAPLREQLAALQAQIAKIERELADAKSAARAIGLVNRIREKPLGVTRKESAPMTIKDAVLEVLADHPKGLIALDLLAEINRRFDRNLIRPSLSPQLTRLKRDGKLISHGSLWMLQGDPDLFLHTDIKAR